MRDTFTVGVRFGVDGDDTCAWVELSTFNVNGTRTASHYFTPAIAEQVAARLILAAQQTEPITLPDFKVG